MQPDDPLDDRKAQPCPVMTGAVGTNMPPEQSGELLRCEPGTAIAHRQPAARTGSDGDRTRPGSHPEGIVDQIAQGCRQGFVPAGHNLRTEVFEL